MTRQKLFCPENVWFNKFLVEKDSAPKMFWVQRNLGFKEIEKFGSFKIIAHRFLIKTNVGKILGAERFGPKQFGSRKKLSPKKCWSKKVWIQKNYGSTKFWVHKILAPKKIWVQIFLDFVSKKICRSKKDCVKQNLVKNYFVTIGICKEGPSNLRNLPWKFGQNRASNSWGITNMDKCRQDKCCLDKCHGGSWHLFKIVPGTYF